MEQKIAQLDINVLQAANCAFTLKAALTRATKCKDIYKKQLELIYTIEVNNMMIKKKVKEK